MKRAIPIFLLALFALLWWISGHRLQSPLEPAQEPSSTPATVSQTATIQPEAAKTSETKTEPSSSVIRFLQEESRSMNARDVDLSQAEEKVRVQAAQLTEADIRYARDLALSRNSPANQRILSAYLLSKSGAKSWAAMEEIILAPTTSARAEPHSQEELQNVQTKAIALMEVDALAEQAAHDPEARDRLQRLEAAAKDATVQKHIRQRLRELPPLR